MTPNIKTGLSGYASATGLAGLLLTTALSAALTPAQAGPLRVSLGGKFVQSINLVDSDAYPRKANTKCFADDDPKAVADHPQCEAEDEVLAQDAEIHFKGKSMLDNGTEIGFRIELEGADASDQIDEHYLYVKGDYGKVILGAENGVGHLMQVRAPSFVPGLKMFDNSLTDEAIEDAYDLAFGPAPKPIADAHMSTKLEHISGDANKITYMTPKVGGLQLGVSLTPNNKDRYGGENNSADVANEITQDDIIEFGVKFSGKTAGLGYKFSHSSVQGNGVGKDVEDAESTSTGLKLSYGKYVFGANVSEYDHLGALGGDYANRVNINNEPDETTTALLVSESIETTNYGLKYRLNDRHYFGIGFTDSDEIRRPSQGVTVTVPDGVLGDDDEIGGAVGSDDEDTDLSETFSGPLTTSYQEMMIGGGVKLAKGVHLGYYYSQGEGAYQFLKTSATAPVAVGDANAADTPGAVKIEVATKDTEVSVVGVTLALKF